MFMNQKNSLNNNLYFMLTFGRSLKELLRCLMFAVCRVSASVQGQEWLSHIDAMHSQFTLLLCLHGYIHFPYLHTQSRLFG